MPLSMLLATFLGFLVFSSVTQAQSMPTNNVLTRMTMIESRYGRGTTFSIDVDGREYWITAKHILTGAEHPPYGSITRESAELRLLSPGGEGEQWLPMTFSVIDAGTDIDIVALAARQPVLQNPIASPSSDASVMLGGDCSFLGFPYGGGWLANMPDGHRYWMPYVKHCTISSIPSTEPPLLVLDGINNPGFSGGPVLYQTGPNQKIVAVISGYHLEPAEVISSLSSKSVNGKEPKKSVTPEQGYKVRVNVNSGFIIAYYLSSAVDAIRKNPIGPLRSATHQ